MAKGKYVKWLEPENLIKLEAWARDGLVDEDIAKNIGISVSTLYEWKKNHPDIAEVLKRGKQVVDIIVENSLYKNATGYDYVEEVSATQKEVYYKDGKREKEVVTPVALALKRHKPPETTAQIYWLKNRKPKEWRDKREVAEEADNKTGGFFEKLKVLNGGSSAKIGFGAANGGGSADIK